MNTALIKISPHVLVDAFRIDRITVLVNRFVSSLLFLYLPVEFAIFIY